MLSSICAAFALAASSMNNGHIGVVHDDGLYLIGARSLRAGSGYTLTSRPGGLRPKYPVGLPAAIAIAWKIAPGNPSLARDVALARGVVIGSGVIFLLASYAWLRAIGCGRLASLLVVGTTAMHHVVLVGGGSTVFADLPFAAITFLLLARTARCPRPTAWGGLVNGLLAGLGLLVRANGLSLGLSSIAASLRGRSRWPATTATFVGLVSVVGLAATFLARVGDGFPSGDYQLELRAAWADPAVGLAGIARNLRGMAWDFPARAVLPIMSYSGVFARARITLPALEPSLKAVTCVALFLGIIHACRGTRRRDRTAWIHTVATLGMFAVWPWTSIMDRFLLSLLPFVILLYALGFTEATRLAGASGGTSQAAFIAALLLAFAASVTVASRSLWNFHSNGGQWAGASDKQELDSALTLIRGLEPDAVVAAHWPETVALYTGRQAVPLVEDDDRLIARIGRVDRLAAWMRRARRRPFYLLIRRGVEDSTGYDAAMARALESNPSMRVKLIAATPRGRYELCTLRLAQ